ncbi:velvet factor [Rhodocollybia butyracea]|uniref:Velvet factor n=1 Tax=Rhodocollybia butyracea TaxID=206335 RepID=A0A9P5Q3X4_9AGAR|nr:velvet factor [Rhodocollybia butyracea]
MNHYSYPFFRNTREYELTVRQEPKQARMCGVGGKADRRPIDPPPIVQLRVIDPGRRANNSGQQSNSPTSPSTTVVNSPTPSTATNRDALRDSSVTDVDGDEDSSTAANAALGSYAQSFLQNPYFFMFASLAKPDDDAELHWLKDGRTRCTTGSTVSSLFSLKDPHHNNEDAGFFVFPDLSVRTEGSYRLKLSLYELVG